MFSLRVAVKQFTSQFRLIRDVRQSSRPGCGRRFNNRFVPLAAQPIDEQIEFSGRKQIGLRVVRIFGERRHAVVAVGFIKSFVLRIADHSQQPFARTVSRQVGGRAQVPFLVEFVATRALQRTRQQFAPSAIVSASARSTSRCDDNCASAERCRDHFLQIRRELGFVFGFRGRIMQPLRTVLTMSPFANAVFPKYWSLEICLGSNSPVSQWRLAKP